MSKILVVDDDAALREVIRLSLQSAGYDVLEAGDGSAGVDAAMTALPDLILCDVRMEKMDGYGMLSALRQNSATASLPFILMTGQADQDGMRQGMELGADDYLPKPFRVDQLIGAVEARLRKQQAVKEQADKQLASLRANISLSLPHELLTPLNGILGFADLLASDASSLEPDEVTSMASAIRESAERLHRLIQNFLLLSHLELHRDDPGALGKGVQEQDLQTKLVEVVNAKARKAGREKDLVLEADRARALTREDYWAKIVEELVDNAFKFSEPGSQVIVRLSRKGGDVVLEVSDRGRGLLPEHIAEMGAYMQFERRFYEQQGSGLGLAIVKKLLEVQGGRLSVSSRVGEGTTIEGFLPAAERDEPS